MPLLKTEMESFWIKQNNTGPIVMVPNDDEPNKVQQIFKILILSVSGQTKKNRNWKFNF